MQIQHNLADLSTWEDIEFKLVHTKVKPGTEHDPFLHEFAQAVVSAAEKKVKNSEFDLNNANMLHPKSL